MTISEALSVYFRPGLNLKPSFYSTIYSISSAKVSVRKLHKPLSPDSVEYRVRHITDIFYERLHRKTILSTCRQTRLPHWRVHKAWTKMKRHLSSRREKTDRTSCVSIFIARSYAERCLSFSISIYPSVRHTPVLCQNEWTYRMIRSSITSTRCLKNCAKLFYQNFRQISTNFDSFWQKDGKEARIMRGVLIFHLT